MKIRSFLAFDINDDMRGELAKLIEVLATKVDGVKWVKPELIHGTIKFFGNVEEEFLMNNVSKVIEREVKTQAPFHLKGVGIGVFPNWRYPRVIWAGLAGETEAMMSLHARLESALEHFNFKRDDRQAFRIHLTIGRTKSKIKDPSALVTFVEKQVDRAYGEITVDHLTLYKSVLTKEGPIYTPLRQFWFGTS